MITLSRYIVSDRYEWGWLIVVDGQSFMRWSNAEFRTVEWHPIPISERFVSMKNDTQTKQKGSEQPPTKVGLDDERTKTGEKKGDREDIGSITDKVMEDQSKHHEVQRT